MFICLCVSILGQGCKCFCEVISFYIKLRLFKALANNLTLEKDNHIAHIFGRKMSFY